MRKTNPQAHSPQWNEKVVLTAAAYFKDYSRPVAEDSNHALFIFANQKGCLLFKTNRNNTTIEFGIFELVATSQGGFVVWYVWEIVVKKNLTNFEGWHSARFYILIWWSFPKIETKNFNSGSCFFKLVKLGTISPAAHFLNCVHIGRSQTIAAIICGLSSGKRFVKLR